MHVLVGKQAGVHFAGGVVDQAALIDAAVVGFVVLESEVGDVIAEAVEEMVVAIVMRSEKLVGLFDQILVMVPDFLGRVEGGGAVGGCIHFDERVVGELYDFEEFSGDYGRVDQRGERCGLEDDLGVAVLAGERRGSDGQGRAVFPAGGKFQRGYVGEIVGLPAFGVEQDLIPADDGHFVGRGGAGGEATFERGGREEVEFGVYF